MIFQCKRENILDQRYNIVFFAIALTFLSAIIYVSEIYTVFAYYIFWAFFLDQIARLFKPASLSEKKVVKACKMTKKQLEKYVLSKRGYRLMAFSSALLIGFITKIWTYEFSAYFIATYAILWSLYPLIRIFYLKIPAPKIFAVFELSKIKNNGKFSASTTFNSSSTQWSSQPSFATNVMTPGTIEWTCNKNRLQ